MWKWFKRKPSDDAGTPKPEHDDEVDGGVTIREPIAVAERILALLAVIGKVHQGNDSRFMDWLATNSIKKYLSHQEAIFLNTDIPEQSALREFSWRAEALTSLLWGINLIGDMPPLNQQFDVYSTIGLSEIINHPDEFKRTIQLRPDNELREMESELYNQHWRVRDAQLFGKEMPFELDPGIVYERRYGLSWLVGWGDDWDEVPTDT